MSTTLTLKQTVASVWQKFMKIVGHKSIKEIGDGTLTGAITELNSNKQEKIICIEIRFRTTANSVINIKDNLTYGTTCPENDSYIPVIIGHASTNSCIEHIFCDGGQWKCYSTDSQVITVRFYKINI